MIRALRPNLSREQALARLRPQGPLEKGLGSPLRSLAAVYVPFRIYQVEITNGGKQDRRLLALDSVNGTLDLYGFDRLPESADLVELETRNHPCPALDAEQACHLVAEKVRRLLFLTGFFRVRNLTVRVKPTDFEFYVPYWVGFFGRGERAHLVVWDAVRCRAEGLKMRMLLHDWLAN